VFRIYVKDIMFLTITVPSWCAEYYLTGNIYVVDQDGVSGYHNRNPGSDLTTRDHRLERIRTGDVRDGLRSAVRDLPDAPCYVVLSLDAEDMDKWYARLETGFAAGNMLLQGLALGVGCLFTTGLSGDVQVEIREVIGAEVGDVPFVVVSVEYVWR
jgi:hypothetical protein